MATIILRDLNLALRNGKLKNLPTDALCLIIPNNACILCLIVVVGTELVDTYYPNTVISFYLGKKVHDPYAFYLHATLVCQAFSYYGKFPFVSSVRILGCVSI